MSLKQRLHAHGWFILVNALVAMLIACRYFSFLPEFPSEPLAVVFIIVSVFGQMTLIAALIGLVALPSYIPTQKIQETYPTSNQSHQLV